MKTPERHALVDRFRERNPTPPDSPWVVDDDALERSVIVIEPFRGFLRRLRRGGAVAHAEGAGSVDEGSVLAAARAFVRRNADLLGLPSSQALVLGASAKRGGATSAWLVRFDGKFESKGYEQFPELENTADLEVALDDHGDVRAFTNLSQIHPRLTLDTHPGLAEDDIRVISKVLGRRVFAVLGDEADDSRIEDRPRLHLGRIEASDLIRIQPVVHRSEGPRLAWVTYRLGYSLVFGKSAGLGGELALGPPVYFFSYVVDADTGDVVEDARAPAVAPLIQTE